MNGKTMKKLSAIGIASLALCALGLPALASEKNPVTRPGQNHGNITAVMELATGLCDFSDWGESTHVGRYSATGWAQMGPTGTFIAGQGTVVAANGDTLDWEIDGTSGVIVWTGGTGRFEGATGGFVATDIVQQPPVDNGDGTVTLRMTYIGVGELTY